MSGLTALATTAAAVLLLRGRGAKVAQNARAIVENASTPLNKAANQGAVELPVGKQLLALPEGQNIVLEAAETAGKNIDKAAKKAEQGNDISNYLKALKEQADNNAASLADSQQAKGRLPENHVVNFAQGIGQAVGQRVTLKASSAVKAAAENIDEMFKNFRHEVSEELSSVVEFNRLDGMISQGYLDELKDLCNLLANRKILSIIDDEMGEFSNIKKVLKDYDSDIESEISKIVNRVAENNKAGIKETVDSLRNISDVILDETQLREAISRQLKFPTTENREIISDLLYNIQNN